MVPVLILLRDQPQAGILRRIDAGGRDVTDRETSRIRAAAFREFREAVEPSQRAVRNRLVSRSATAIGALTGVNLMTAWVPSAAIAELEQDPNIAEIALSRLYKTQLDTSVPAMGTSSLWSAGFTGGSQTVGVIDTGVRPDHPAFRGVNVTALAFLQTASQDPCFGDLASSGVDQQLHGTHVSGIVVGQGVSGAPNSVGVAPGVGRLYSLKAGFRTKPVAGRCQAGEGRFATADWLQAMDFLIQNTPTRVINMSFGGGVEADDTLPARIVDFYADLFGVTFTIAAGNEGPGAYTVGSPGIAYNAITVANMNTRGTVTTADDAIAQSSSRGPTIGFRSKPDIAAPGSNIRAADLNSNGLVALTGTSMAAPHVAGAAVLLRDSGIRDALSIKALLIASATVQVEGWQATTGWGFINLGAAHAARANIIRSEIAAGSTRYYKGSASGLRAALVWNRRFATNPADTTRSSFPLNNLDLVLYNGRDNTAVSRSATRQNNVEAVSASGPGDYVLKVSAPDAAFGGGQGDEPFALALTARGFTEVAGPQPSMECAAPTTVAAGAIFSLRCTATNSGGLELFRLAVTPRVPSGFTGASTQTFATLAPGQAQTLTWTLRAPEASGVSGSITVSGSANAFDESYAVAAAPIELATSGTGSGSGNVTLTLSGSALSFAQTRGGALAASQTINIAASNGAAVPLSGTINSISGGSWFAASLSQTSTPSVLTVRLQAAAANLAAGTYTGTINLTSTGASNSPLSIGLRLEVNAPASSTISIERPRIAKTVSIVDGCPVPDEVTQLAATDARAYLWFIARGARTGDSPVVEWYGADGSVYERQSLWSPTADGAYCYAPSLAIDRIPASERSGTWRARLLWNGQQVAEQTFALLATPAISSAVISGTKEDPGNCDQPARAMFRTTDEVVKACFVIAQVRAGDRFAIRFLRPDGTRHGQYETEPIAADTADYMIWQWYAIQGFPVAGFTGEWKVELAWNGSVIRTLNFRLNPAVTVELSRVTNADPERLSCADPGSTRYFLPRDLTATVWFTVADAQVGDLVKAEFVAPDGSVWDTVEWDPIDEDGQWCLWTWIDVADGVAKGFGTWKARVSWNDAAVMTQEFQILPVDVTGFRVTRQTVPNSVCSTPEENTTFVTTDVQARLWFTVDLAKAGDVASVEWLSPAGAVVSRTTFNPLSSGGAWCLAATLPIAGQNRPVGEWTVTALWNGDEVGRTKLRIDRPALEPVVVSSVASVERSKLEEIREEATLRSAADGAESVEAERTGRGARRMSAQGRRETTATGSRRRVQPVGKAFEAGSGMSVRRSK
ncbi:hypothetical protein F183_A29900 [Bryobacterales bacterium F-183]|nr:hypothetical protein F183_A29900 [Bryobacterales bacterium F-183]